jgi:hypothetical protein
MLDDLLAGANVEPGVHIAEIHTKRRAGSRRQKLHIR